MDLPNVVHPTIYEADGIRFQVLSYAPLTEEQAQKAVILFRRTQKLSKKHKGQTLQVWWIHDKDELGLI